MRYRSLQAEASSARETAAGREAAFRSPSNQEVRLADVLAECLEAMERGEQNIDLLSARYPDAKRDIRPLLAIAKLLRQAQPWPPEVLAG
ncbi:MAG: hypothetical protein HYS09_02955 [Chloroflexi bacterium]|nr:hypothetical protein [Chloroflexota bacterium]